MACLRFPAGSLLPFSGGVHSRVGTQRYPTAGQDPLAKAEASRPHSKAGRWPLFDGILEGKMSRVAGMCRKKS